jgi:hypothetical protein
LYNELKKLTEVQMKRKENRQCTYLGVCRPTNEPQKLFHNTAPEYALPTPIQQQRLKSTQGEAPKLISSSFLPACHIAADEAHIHKTKHHK